LLALKEAGAKDDVIREAAQALLKAQRADGSWAQLDDKPGDAYATGSALVALHEAGGLSPTDPVYRRGLWFLLRAQRPDGSWEVRSRSKPFQPYYESGFPYGKDQFISATASGWATAALATGSGPGPGERVP
jgi:squalene cyclase